MLILVAGLAVGCSHTRTTYYTPAPATTTTVVYTPTDRASCQAAGGHWHIFSRTCTIPR